MCAQMASLVCIHLCNRRISAGQFKEPISSFKREVMSDGVVPFDVVLVLSDVLVVGGKLILYTKNLLVSIVNWLLSFHW